MRTIPQSIKNALKDKSLPLKKQVLMYRRAWNSTTSAYELESSPVDVTHLLQESSSIKMALDTDEVDKWDASNVTLTFKNTLNCFKEGLPNGLFESAVLWGSKFVYLVKNADKNAPNDSVAVFTGYVYSSPVFKDNGNFISLTITSSLDALEYVSAEDFCYTKTDELGTLVTSQNSNDQGKEFSTSETGVGYIDSVKYGATLETANTLAAGADYSVSQLNEYSKNAVIKLNFTPTSGYSAWISYRYWHKDMKIEDIVNSLLDLSGTSNRAVEQAQFSTQGIEYVDDVQHKNYNLFCSFDGNDVVVPQFPRNDDRQWYGGNMEWRFNVGRKTYTESTLRVRFPTRGFLGLMSPNAPFYSGANVESNSWGSITLYGENGLSISISYTNPNSNIRVTVSLTDNGNTQTLYVGKNVGIAGFDFKDTGLELLAVGIYNNGWINTDAGVYKIFIGGTWNDFFNQITMRLQSGTNYQGRLSSQISWRESNLIESEYTGKTIYSFFTYFFSTEGTFATQPKMRIFAELTEEATSWNQFTYTKSIVSDGVGAFTYSTSEDGETWSAEASIDNGSRIDSSAHYLRIYLTITSYPGYITAENILISSFVSYIPIPLVNMTGLTVGEAIAQLAQMVSYEIGFNQDGVFFFRPRSASYTAIELSPNQLIDVSTHSADIEDFANRISVSFGQFSSIVDDNTEGKSHPNSIDTYGIHEKEISDSNLIPADNVDISYAVALSNYGVLSQLGYTARVECVPFLELELGDKIRVNSQNTEIADKQWTDHTKFEQLPIWKRVFKIIGIELAVDKRKMVLNLKDVTTSADEPEETMYEFVYDFPLTLGVKK
ncbi:hypothetical protein IJI18_00700 [Candidatus Saccharibacteria bacterium]|nr:hypothetical protein [Candidatus Saccharibacteria bacterium]